MNCKRNYLLFLLACFAWCFLAFASPAIAAINTGDGNYDGTIQTKLDWLMLEVASKKIQTDAAFLEDSAFNSMLNSGVMNQGPIRDLYLLALDLAKQAKENPDDLELQEKAKLALDQLLLQVLYQVIEQKDLKTIYQNMAQMMIDILEGKETVEGFSDDPFVFEGISGQEGNDPTPPDPNPNPDPDPEGWLFYGRAYDLDTDVILTNNGMLTFSDTPFSLTISWPETQNEEPSEDFPPPSVTLKYPPTIAPYFMHALPSIEEFSGDGFDYIGYFMALSQDFNIVVNGETLTTVGDFEDLLDELQDDGPSALYGKTVTIELVPQQIFEEPSIVKNADFYRYTWDRLQEGHLYDDEFLIDPEDPNKFPAYSTALYRNNWISFVYSDINKIYDFDGENAYLPMHTIFTGLMPGDGGAGHPGEGLARALVERLGYSENWWETFGKFIDISKETGQPFFNSEDDFDDFLVQLGAENPSAWEELITILEESGYNIITDEETDRTPGGEYLTIGEVFLSFGQGGRIDECIVEWLGFDLSDKFVIFIPDAPEGYTPVDQGVGNRYKVVTGTPTMVVDRSRHNFDESNFDGYSSLDQGILAIADGVVDLETQDFRPGFGPIETSGVTAWDGITRWNQSRGNQISGSGEYQYGLQTVGHRDGDYQYTPQIDQYNIDQSNLLAYLVQVEEDIVNEKILEISAKEEWQDMVDGIRSYDRIKARDAMFVEKADAQAGRVMKDTHGNWVRVQQYILRPDKDTQDRTVQVLNVTLRDATSGNISGLSTIDFTTTFVEALGTKELKDLPWGRYLTTYEIDGLKMILNPEDRQLDNMYVKFTNAGEESIKEERYFYNRYVAPEAASGMPLESVQYVKSETLSIVSGLGDYPTYTNTFGDPATFGADSDTFGDSNYRYRALFTNDASSGYYQTTTAGEIQIGDNGPTNKILDVAIYQVSDFNGHDGIFNEGTRWGAGLDMWAALGAGENGGAAVDPDSSLEIVMNSSAGTSYLLSNPIDVIYIPMSHMMWTGDYDVN